MQRHSNRAPRCVSRALRIQLAFASALSLLALTAVLSSALGQSALPPVVVTTPAKSQSQTKQQRRQRPAPASKAQPKQASTAPAAPALTAPQTGFPGGGVRSGSLTVPTTAERQRELATIPGAVTLVPDTDYKTSTPAANIKDVLDYVPGVFVQPKWGDNSRLSIRGSGLSRNFHLRGINLYLDGIPINTADGFGDFQEIDPSAYRYTEVYRGANGLRFGASSLGGAINFVTPTGRDASLFGASADIGSFGYRRIQSSTGGAKGPVDYFVTGSFQEQDGFREHSWGEATRASANVGVRVSDTVETRFYLNANEVRQRIPGSVIKSVALASPTTPAAINVINDWQRNIDTVRVANKTTILVAPGTVLELGIFGVDRHLMHPIFEWLDYKYQDYGAYTRVMNQTLIAGFRNRLLVGFNLNNGSYGADQFVNIGGIKGAMTSSSRNEARNATAYAENAFYVLPDVALVAGIQYLNAERILKDRFLSNGDQSGRSSFDVWNPNAGLLWEIDKGWQAFVNVTRSAEVPSFGENAFAAAASFDAKLQTAVTYEIGTRGRRANLTWDIAAYRSQISNELQCTFPFGIADFCVIRNADKTIHQGVEFGFGVSILDSMLVQGPNPDRLWLRSAYTYSDFRFDDDPLYGNNQLPGAPPHFLRSELLYKHPSGIFFGPNFEWVPQAYYVDSANTLATEPYAIWDLKVGYDPGTSFSAYIEGRNLGDKRYIASAGITDVANLATTNLFEPGTGRAVYAGVRYKW